MSHRRGNGEDELDAASPPPARDGGGERTPEAPAPEEPTGLESVPEPAPSREELEALRRERDDLRDQLLRRRAEFENYRKRVERDRQQAGLEAAVAVFQTLLPTLDSLDQALASDAADAASLRAGVELIQRGLLAALEAQGVVCQDPGGRPFDPQIHQALSHEAVPGVAEGTVVEVFRKGYFFKDRLLRPALVKVASGDEASAGDDEHANGVD